MGFRNHPYFEEKKYFVDEQLYRSHMRFGTTNTLLRKWKGGVELEDIIDYKVPLGILGQLVHPILVKAKTGRNILPTDNNKLD